MRRFVVIGQRASSRPDFRLEDIPGTGGRIDALLRCLRSALLVSHGLRSDTAVYLVLLGSPGAPRTVRVDGAVAKYLRPDERSLAVTLRKLLELEVPADGAFVVTRTGLAIASGGLETAVADIGAAPRFVLDESGTDVRTALRDVGTDATFFVGDHLGFAAPTLERLVALGSTPVSVGPISLHAEDAITIVGNELDRRRVGEAHDSGRPMPT